jgi:hypothetical protein
VVPGRVRSRLFPRRLLPLLLPVDGGVAIGCATVGSATAGIADSAAAARPPARGVGRYDRPLHARPTVVKGGDDMQERVIETDLSWCRFTTNPYPRRPAEWEGGEDHEAALAALATMLSRVPKRPRRRTDSATKSRRISCSCWSPRRPVTATVLSSRRHHESAHDRPR